MTRKIKPDVKLMSIRTFSTEQEAVDAIDESGLSYKWAIDGDTEKCVVTFFVKNMEEFLEANKHGFRALIEDM